jgi:ATP/maltotriose-dependent transcriptional regulator MalT
MALHKTTYEKLLKRLGALDKERREILKDLRNSPEFITKYVNDLLKEFIAQKKWVVRKNAKGEESYFSLKTFVLNDKSLTKTDRGSVIINGTLTWENYDYNATEKRLATETIAISAFNEIENQILNGRTYAPKFNEKVIQKNVLTAKKKLLEEELKKVKTELAGI